MAKMTTMEIGWRTVVNTRMEFWGIIREERVLYVQMEYMDILQGKPSTKDETKLDNRIIVEFEQSDAGEKQARRYLWDWFHKWAEPRMPAKILP